MTLTLEPWLIVPVLLTVLLVAALLHQALTDVLTRSDVFLLVGVWAVLIVVSLLSIWSAT